MSTNDRFASVGQDGYVTAEDVLFLRKNVYQNHELDQAEINSLLALAERAPEGDVEWPEFFGEASADYYFREELPHDFITERAFEELHNQVTRYSETVTPLVLSMLVKLIDRATATPPKMKTFIQQQIKAIIMARPGEPVISKIDVSNIRRFMFAIGSDENIAISRSEAEFLFSLNDLTICGQNDPAWSELFIKAITNHLMAHIGYSAPSREEALQQWNWVQEHDVNVGNFFQRMVSGGLSAIREVYAPTQNASPDAEKSHFGEGSLHEKILKKREEQARIAEEVTSHEGDWLATRIGRDGIFDDNERALVAYMRSLDAILPPALQKLIDEAA